MAKPMIAIVGRPNVGKSTLLNNIVGEKVAATANKVQTTRTAIKAILNDDNYQIIITDTPGIHKPKTKLSETMVNTAFTMFAEVDVILFLIEADSTEIGRGDRIILDKIKESNRKTIHGGEKISDRKNLSTVCKGCHSKYFMAGKTCFLLN